MSQNGLPLDYDEPWISDALDLSIKTLTGTTFEIRVSPEDTIMSIKAKIQRAEGIAISQQHLLYNMVELQNSAAVRDYKIPNGGILQLVLSMRGGPISTRRLPPADEALWREVQEWMSEGRRDDLNDQSSPAAKTSIVVFRDGNSVNLFRVVENDDGTYSPLSQSPSAPSLKDVLAKDDQLGFGRRMMENWVTMGKMQELKGKLEKLSITKKDKKCDEVSDESDEQQLPVAEDELRSSTSSSVNAHCSEGYLRYRASAELAHDALSASQQNKCKKVFAVNEGASCSSVRDDALHSARLKARKDADNIIRLQSKSLSVVVDGHGLGSLKRTPLPDIKKTLRPERMSVDEVPVEEKSEVRGKTASRMATATSTFAILEEENDVGPSSSICSSASSMVALPSNNDVVVSYSPLSRDHGSAIGGRSFRLSSYLLGSTTKRPKTAPSLEKSKSERSEYGVANESSNANLMKHVMCSTVELAPSWYKSRLEMRDLSTQPQLERTETEPRYMEQLRVVTQRSSTRPSEPPPPLPAPTEPEPAPTPAPAKKPRCSVCKKRLNITNTHTCRCEGVFCSTHRYSETHDCHFDYKVEGKHLLRLANPLVTAPKLPKL